MLVSAHLAEKCSFILVQLTNSWDRLTSLSKTNEIPQPPDILQENSDAPLFALNEPETHEADLAFIPEEESDPALPTTIDDILVNPNPHAENIKELVHFKRIGRSGSAQRRNFYLAKTPEENYYWISPPKTGRDREMNQLIASFRYKKKSKKNVTSGKHWETKI